MKVRICKFFGWESRFLSLHFSVYINHGGSCSSMRRDLTKVLRTSHFDGSADQRRVLSSACCSYLERCPCQVYGLRGLQAQHERGDRGRKLRLMPDTVLSAGVSKKEQEHILLLLEFRLGEIPGTHSSAFVLRGKCLIEVCMTFCGGTRYRWRL